MWCSDIIDLYKKDDTGAYTNEVSDYPFKPDCNDYYRFPVSGYETKGYDYKTAIVLKDKVNGQMMASFKLTDTSGMRHFVDDWNK